MTTTMPPLAPAARLAGMRPYGPRTTTPDDGRTLVLDANEGRGPDERVLARLAEIGENDLRRYPSSGDLERRLAVRFEIAPTRVLVTAGADDATDRICRAVLEPGRRAVVMQPTFEMIARYAQLAGAGITRVPWRASAITKLKAAKVTTGRACKCLRFS